MKKIEKTSVMWFNDEGKQAPPAAYKCVRMLYMIQGVSKILVKKKVTTKNA